MWFEVKLDFDPSVRCYLTCRSWREVRKQMRAYSHCTSVSVRRCHRGQAWKNDRRDAKAGLRALSENGL